MVQHTVWQIVHVKGKTLLNVHFSHFVEVLYYGKMDKYTVLTLLLVITYIVADEEWIGQLLLKFCYW